MRAALFRPLGLAVIAVVLGTQALRSEDFNPFAMADFDAGNLKVLSKGSHPEGVARTFLVVKGDRHDPEVFDGVLPALGRRLAREGYVTVAEKPAVIVVVFTGVDDLRRTDGENALIGARPTPRMVDTGGLNAMTTTVPGLPPGVTVSVPGAGPRPGQFDGQFDLPLWANYRTWMVAVGLDAAATKASGRPVEIWSIRLIRTTPDDLRAVNASYLSGGMNRLLKPTEGWEARSVRRKPVVEIGDPEYLDDPGT
jgi:hypothetical protein